MNKFNNPQEETCKNYVIFGGRKALTELITFKDPNLEVGIEKIMRLNDQEIMAEADETQRLIDPETGQLPTALIRCLYVGHFFSRWSARLSLFYPQ